MRKLSYAVTTRNIVLIAVIAALYTVLTIGLAPFSYGPLQFRVAEFLKVFVLYNPWLSFGIGIGTFFANLASPYVGPLELFWMPATDIAGGLLAWAVYRLMNWRYPFMPMFIYAFTTSLAVGLMLFLLGGGVFLAVTIPIFVSEAVILIAAIPIANLITRRVDVS